MERLIGAGRRAWRRWRGTARPDSEPPFPGATYADWLARYETPFVGTPPVDLRVAVLDGSWADAGDDAPPAADVVTCLPTGDRLASDAAAWVADAFASSPTAVLVYTDDDTLGADGVRRDPRWKPDLNLDLLRSVDYIGPALFVRVDALRRVTADGPVTGTHDLVLRVVDAYGEAAVVHVPRVCWHRAPAREPGEARPDPTAAVTAHLARRGLAARVEPAPGVVGACRVRWPVPDPAPSVTLIVLTRDHPDLLRAALDSIERHTHSPEHDVVVVDNGSVDADALALLDEIARRPHVGVRHDPRPFNWSALNNAAAADARGDVLVFLNDDVEATDPEWLTELVSQAVRPDVGVVGAHLWYPDGTRQHAGMVLHPESGASALHQGLPRGQAGHLDRAALVQDVSAVTGACLAVRADVFRAVGGFDESFPYDFNDIDLCLRVGEQGLRCVWTPYAELVHREGASRGGWDDRAHRTRWATAFAAFAARWGDRLAADPAWNPNAAATLRDPPLAWPPRGRG